MGMNEIFLIAGLVPPKALLSYPISVCAKRDYSGPVSRLEIFARVMRLQFSSLTRPRLSLSSSRDEAALLRRFPPLFFFRPPREAEAFDCIFYSEDLLLHFTKLGITCFFVVCVLSHQVTVLIRVT